MAREFDYDDDDDDDRPRRRRRIEHTHRTEGALGTGFGGALGAGCGCMSVPFVAFGVFLVVCIVIAGFGGIFKGCSSSTTTGGSPSTTQEIKRIEKQREREPIPEVKIVPKSKPEAKKEPEPEKASPIIPEAKIAPKKEEPKIDPAVIAEQQAKERARAREREASARLVALKGYIARREFEVAADGLRKLIKTYPGTDAAAEAEKILKNIQP